MTPRYRPPRDPEDTGLRIICGLLVAGAAILSAYEIYASLNF